jgi:predicted transcriptional regulator
MKITDVYTKVKNADIRAMSVIIAKEASDRSKSDHAQEGYSSLKNLDNAFNKTKQEAIKSIDEILKEPWLSRHVQKS